jgi:hypothetical protein
VLDFVGGMVAFILTLAVLSYLIGDNPLFRAAIHIFIGVAAGFAAVVMMNNVILPRLIIPLVYGTGGTRLLALIPLVLSGLLFLKISPHLGKWGTLPVAYLVGAGVAVGIGGVITGTLLPQAVASINLLDLTPDIAAETTTGIRIVNGIIILLGTITTLAYFQFVIRSKDKGPSRLQAWLEGLGQAGQVFIAIALGFIFSGIYSAALIALIDRINFLINWVKPFFSS